MHRVLPTRTIVHSRQYVEQMRTRIVCFLPGGGDAEHLSPGMEHPYFTYVQRNVEDQGSFFPPMAFDLQVQPWILWVSLALASICTVQTIKRHTTHVLPPGPSGIPFFGPLFQLSATPWKEFETWKAQYGKLVALLFIPNLTAIQVLYST